MAMMKIDGMNFAEVIGGGQPVLVEFGAPWCVYCRRIEPVLKKVAEQYDGKLMVGAVDNLRNSYIELTRKEFVEMCR